MSSPRTLADVLRVARERGVISPEQDAELQRIAAEVRGGPEVARGFNWVTAAYGLGAMLVVFACGWFLAERWMALGPAGVLLVSLSYALVLGVSSRWLAGAGFPEAAGVAAMLGVSLTPVVVWCLESLTGWWPVEDWGRPYYPEWPAAESSRWIVVELATILVALVVLRKRRYVAVVFPIAVALFGLVLHLPRAIGIEAAPLWERWSMLTGALMVCAIADTVDRRVVRSAGDHAFPLWVVGLLTLGASLLSFWPTMQWLRHTMPLVAVAVVAAGLFTARRTHMVFGVVVLFMYLMYLAADVFRDTPWFPVSLALLGGLLLFATVWLQRRAPVLVQRLSARREGRGGLPGSLLLPWLLAAAVACMTLLQIPAALEERESREFQQRLQILRSHSHRKTGTPQDPAGAPVRSKQ